MSLLERRRREVERRIGMRVVLRGIRTPDPRFRGRVSERPGYLLVEYQVAQPGYFWEAPVVEKLLDLVEAGERELELEEPGD